MSPQSSVHTGVHSLSPRRRRLPRSSVAAAVLALVACALHDAGATHVAAGPPPTPTPTEVPLQVVVVGPLPVKTPHHTEQPATVQVIAPVANPGDVEGVVESPPSSITGPVNLPPVAALPSPTRSAPTGDSVLPVAVLALFAGILLAATLLLSRRRL